MEKDPRISSRFGEIDAQETNPYSESILIKNLKERIHHNKPLRLGFVDIDGTLTMDHKIVGIPLLSPDVTDHVSVPSIETEQHEVTASSVRKTFDSLGFVLIAVTSRPEEMVMDERSFKLSHEEGLDRRAPHLLQENGKFVYKDPKDLHAFDGLLNFPVIIAETGSRILLRQPDGAYRIDTSFEEHMQQHDNEWRSNTISTLETLIAMEKLPNVFRNNIPPVDFEGSYEEGRENVAPLPFRVHVDFKDKDKTQRENSDDLQDFISKMELLRHDKEVPEFVREKLRNIRLSNDSNPDSNRFSVYLTPHFGYKARAIEHLITNVCEELQLSRSALETVIAGDSFADLGAILYAGLGTKATGIVVGGARITKSLVDDHVHQFAGQKIDTIKNRLEEDKEWSFTIPKFGKRRIIIGDVDFPGTIGPETIVASLHTLYPM